MAIKDQIKWIFTRTHFWIIVAIYSAWGIYADIDLFGGFYPSIIIGSIFGNIVFIFICYAILRIIYLKFRKKENK